MEHADFSGSHFSSIWESLSTDDCVSATCSFLPELSSPENCPWLLPQTLSKHFLEDGYLDHHEFIGLDRSLVSAFRNQDCQKNVEVAANPDSPCSPLLFSLCQDPNVTSSTTSAHAGALHMQIQELPFSPAESKLPGKSHSHARYRKPPAQLVVNAHVEKGEARVVEGDKRVTMIKEECVQAEEDEEEYPPAKRRCSVESRSSEIKSQGDSTSSSITSTVALGPALNTDGKPRAKRGSATDPQSVYARQRRERINERLRALQGLVPNGAKVDIVTMLEEAINYVKFLQLQVKLLSSDEYWMYAPTTYNGMNISLGMHLGMQNYLKVKE